MLKLLGDYGVSFTLYMGTNRIPRGFKISREKKVSTWFKNKNKNNSPFIDHHSSRISMRAAFMLPSAALVQGTFQMRVV